MADSKVTIGLENLEPRLVVYNLAHPAHMRLRKVPQIQELKGGKQIGVFVKKRMVTSLTLKAKERRFGLARTVLECLDIKAAVDAHPPRLRVLEGPIVDRSQRQSPIPVKRPRTKPAKPKPSAGNATLTEKATTKR